MHQAWARAVARAYSVIGQEEELDRPRADDALMHRLRPRFGVQLAIRGVSLATLQQLIGHTDPHTTAPQPSTQAAS